MNPFTKEWLTATCAPESIINLQSKDTAYLDAVTNEDKSIIVKVLSTNTKVLGIGITHKELLKSPHYTFKEALHKIAELLQVQSISTK